MIPASQRIRGVLEMRKGASTLEWMFPSPTKSGQIESSTLKKQHAAALKLCDVEPFAFSRFVTPASPDGRNTWIRSYVLAGHTDMNTAKRYVHPDETQILEAMSKVRVVILLGIPRKRAIRRE